MIGLAVVDVFVVVAIGAVAMRGDARLGTAQYTVPSVSTQTMTPRRAGFFACSSAPPRAEPAGPSV